MSLQGTVWQFCHTVPSDTPSRPAATRLRSAHGGVGHCAMSRLVRVLPPMTDGRRDQRSPSWVSLVLRDAQFWVPVAVLCGGLLVLRWIH
jgi:hypothetical protein